jgi:hypothetical protein
VDIEFSAPVNIERLVQDYPNVDMTIQAGLQFNHRVEGCVCKHMLSRNITVCIDQRVFTGPWPTYNQVLAEEYAHIVLHPPLFDYVQSVDDFVELQTDPQWHRYESDAKKFSVAIRMPPALVTSETEIAYRRVIDEYGFPDTASIEKHIRNRLAQTFRVSPEDMWRRMIGYPCYLRGRLLNSIQSKSERLLPSSWTVEAAPPTSQKTLFSDLGHN